MLAKWRTKISAYRIYLVVQFMLSCTLAMIYTTVIVYRMNTAGLNPLELVLIGTVLEIAYFVFQLPTGVIADAVSRRLSVIVGIAVLGGAFVMEGLLPFFLGIAAAQVVRALGFAFFSGAQEAWIADEQGDINLTHVYLRGSQAGLVGSLVGTPLSGLTASIRLNLPLVLGGAALAVIAVVLVAIMPETNFHRSAEAEGIEVAPSPWTTASRSMKAMTRLLQSSPVLLLLFGVVAFFGTWHEAFDRLWGALLLHKFTFPALGRLSSVFWFSIISFVATLLSLGTTELIRRKVSAEQFTTHRVVAVLIALTVLAMTATATFGLAGNFLLALVAFWVLSALRPAYEPLMTALTANKVDNKTRATMLSAKDMFDAAGQFVGGPAIGVIGMLFSLRTAIVAAAGTLLPACALLTAMLRATKLGGRKVDHGSPQTQIRE